MRLLTASVTPFFPNFTIDFSGLESLLRVQNAIGNGVVLLGSTGEGLSLTQKEKQAIVCFACNLQLNIPIFVGVAGILLDEVLDWIYFCNDLPISGFLMTSPIYSKPKERGQFLWFESLLNAAKHSAILYNIPARAGTPLYTDTVKALVNHPRFLGIKDSGGSIEEFQRYKKNAPNIHLYCGDDICWSDMARSGAYGLISVLSNAWPQEAKDYVQSPSEEAYASLWKATCRWLYKTTNPIGIKAVLAYKNYIAHPDLRLPLSIEDFDSYDLPRVVENMLAWPKLSTSILSSY
ncbi:Dihydrodipicolinate synthase,dihydrodipicolinate synthase,dihydrodipicolinate synthase,Dihydrodipicolinate synthetase family [Chlamydia serpentis]|uniref:4-hydroxy-tetrahydrodipicolinate synthase n=1 Tax=Chlamydia serpentis TaxID=1967782 RepID=A0A2R8FCK2_9CHLA|nr:4-hydroxy-tetrahydrodipicolinate synthase [Chlamydia serpentis]SPN74155.1 Dihydrodipicolinate synthase,dihydrodipicolinate synthase,dihydrodipicolinate synthase,Dihydrodipicolinate synthetase family [Chlamydia serpentis]